jgi:hypothetical protein
MNFNKWFVKTSASWSNKLSFKCDSVTFFVCPQFPPDALARACVYHNAVGNVVKISKEALSLATGRRASRFLCALFLFSITISSRRTHARTLPGALLENAFPPKCCFANPGCAARALRSCGCGSKNSKHFPLMKVRVNFNLAYKMKRR